MSGGAVAQEVQELLRDHIENFDDLEILLLLFRRQEWWLAEAICKELRATSTTVEPMLEHLRAHGLLEVRADTPQQFRYRAATSDLDGAVDALSKTYAEDRLAVMKLMNTNAVERIRNSGLRIFAEAFRVKGPKDDG